MKKTFNFGKVDYLGIGKKNCPVEVEVELDENGVFTASGMIYNHMKTDCYCGGQCLDTIAKYVDDKTFNEIYTLWKKWHLNDMHAGTIEQEQALNNWEEKPKYWSYEQDCEYLKSIGLYEVQYNGEPYRYGTKWIKYDIDKNDLQMIYNLLGVSA